MIQLSKKYVFCCHYPLSIFWSEVCEQTHPCTQYTVCPRKGLGFYLKTRGGCIKKWLKLTMTSGNVSESERRILYHYLTTKQWFGVLHNRPQVPFAGRKPATHESDRLSKSYSCMLAQPISHHVRVLFLLCFVPRATLSLLLNRLYARKGCLKRKTQLNPPAHCVSYRLSYNQCQNALDKISNNTTLLYIWPPVPPPPFKILYTKPTTLFRVGGGRELLYP